MDGIESSNICLYDVEVKNEQINVTLVGKIMSFQNFTFMGRLKHFRIFVDITSTLNLK